MDTTATIITTATAATTTATIITTATTASTSTTSTAQTDTMVSTGSRLIAKFLYNINEEFVIVLSEIFLIDFIFCFLDFQAQFEICLII